MLSESSTESEEGLWLFGYGSLIWKPPPHFDRRVPGYIEGYVRRFWQASQDHRGTPENPGRVATLISREHWETLTDYVRLTFAGVTPADRAEHASAPPRTWGAAYHIPPAKVTEVKEYLDIREINGYSIDMAAFHVPVHMPGISNTMKPDLAQTRPDKSAPEESGISSAGQEAPAPIKCLVYIGLPSNPQFVGPQDPDELARHILTHRGPSGENKEYLYMLEEALEGLKRETGVKEEIDEHVVDLTRRVRRQERLMLVRNGNATVSETLL